MSYREWREKAVRSPYYNEAFWAIVDFNWKPAEQNRLAREWKEGSAVT